MTAQPQSTDRSEKKKQFWLLLITYTRPNKMEHLKWTQQLPPLPLDANETLARGTQTQWHGLKEEDSKIKSASKIKIISTVDK